MKHILYILFIGVVLAAAGCDNGGSSTSPQISYTSIIVSDSSYDGDIERIAANSFTITQGMSPTVQSVFAGVDPGALTEFRAFLDFPLGGAGGVPYDAVIDSAYLDIFIDSIQSNTDTIPILIDLVTFQPPNLVTTDFDRGVQPSLATISIRPPISVTDVGSNISIDVTALMEEAQSRGFTDFQLRILEDFEASPGLIEINDTTGTNRTALAPQLTVIYH